MDSRWMRMIETPRFVQVVSGGVLAVAQMYSRVEEMSRHRALTVAKETDLPMLDAHFQFLEEALDSRRQTRQSHGVVSLTGAPEISAGSKINPKRLIDASSSLGCLAFRKWLVTAHQLSDDEVKGALQSLATRAGIVVGGQPGRIIRFLVSTAAGFIPVVGSAAGDVLGGLDNSSSTKSSSPAVRPFF